MTNRLKLKLTTFQGQPLAITKAVAQKQNRRGSEWMLVLSNT